MKKHFLKVLLIIITLLIFGLLFLNKQFIVENIPIRYLIVKSESMYPILKKNDIIIIKTQKNYNLNDVITYEDEDCNLITHRIVKIENEGFIMKGDNNTSNDEKIVKKENIKGKMILVLSKAMLLKIYSLFLVLMIFLCLWKGYKYEKNN